jgi:hypothetical protein
MRPHASSVMMGIIGLSLASGVAFASPSDHTVTFSRVIDPPSTNSFDISFVDNSTGKYFLADRRNNAVDLIDAAHHDVFSGPIGQGVFAGQSPLGRPHSGPNGVLTDRAGLVWAGDGDSTIKVLRDQPNTGSAALINSLATGGTQRADEESYDGRDQLILIANDFEGFLTFVDVKHQKIAGHFYYADNTVGQPASVSGHSTAGGGIEQSVYVPQTGLFYQAVPANSPATTGFIDVFDPVSEKLVATFPAAGCTNGPTGLALGPNQRFLGACDNGALAIGVRHGHVHKIVPGVGGADEIWFNPGDNNFYLGISSPTPSLGVVDADNDHVVQVIPNRGGHSVAAYARTNHIFDPIAAGGGIDLFVSADDD